MTNLGSDTRNILDTHQQAILATAVGDLPAATAVRYHRHGDDLVLAMPVGALAAAQLAVNPRTQLTIPAADGTAGLVIEGRGSPVTARDAEALGAAMRGDETDGVERAPVSLVRLRPTAVWRTSNAGGILGAAEELRHHESPPLVDGLRGVGRRLGLFIRALRAPFFTASLVPIALGAALAVHDGSPLLWGQLGWVTLALLLAHAGTNLANDYFDHRTRNDEHNESFTPLNGGSRIIQSRLWSPDRVLVTALLAFVGCVVIAMTQLTVIPRSLMLTLGGVGIALGYFYCGWPLRLVYHGLGDLAVAIGFGPLVTGGTYAVLTGAWSWRAAAASIPVALAVALILFINGFQDAEADARVGKRTWVVRLGSKARALTVFAWAWVAIYLSIVVLVVTRVLPWWALVALVTAPLAYRAVRTGRQRCNEIEGLLPVNFATVGLHLAVGVLLTAGVVVATVLG